MGKVTFEQCFVFEKQWQYYDQSIETPIDGLLKEYGLNQKNNREHIEWLPLPFYKDCKLLRMSSFASEELFPAYFILSPKAESLHYLNGSSQPIHYINENVGLYLSDDNVQQYLQFFCFFVQADGGSFHVINSEDHLLIRENKKIRSAYENLLSDIEDNTEDKSAADEDSPTDAVPDIFGKKTDWTLDAIILYGNAFFQAQFIIYPEGFVEMTNDKPLVNIEDNLPIFRFPKLEKLDEEKQRSDRNDSTQVQIIDYVGLKNEQSKADREHSQHLRGYISRLKQNKGKFSVNRYSGSIEELEAMISILNTEFPQMHEVNDFIRETMVFNIIFKQGEIAIPAILLGGPEATGKSRYIQRLAELLDLPKKVFDFATTSAAFIIAGASRIWKSGQPGLIAETFVENQVANPLMAIEELDKSTGREQYSALNTLYTLLEPNSAKEFADEYLNVNINCQYVNWIATCNSTEALPSPIRSRFQFFYIEKPNKAQRKIIAGSVYSQLLEELNIAPFFSTHLSEAVISLIAVQSQDLRDMKRLIKQALVKASVRSDRIVEADRAKIDKIEITLFDCKGNSKETDLDAYKTELTH